MIRRMLGAPLGGTTCGGQYGFDRLACRLMTPPNGGGGGGRYFPSMVVVALGEPGVPVICCAAASIPASRTGMNAASGATRLKIGESFGMGRLLTDRGNWTVVLRGGGVPRRADARAGCAANPFRTPSRCPGRTFSYRARSAV